MFLAGAFSRLGLNASNAGELKKAAGYGDSAVAMIYLFTFVFGATWFTVPWLYPAEIFPLEVRAKRGAWGVVGWSIGNGWMTLLCPVMFKALDEKTYYIFGACNVITIPMVWAFYLESNQRTLEEMNLLFASDEIFNWEAERNFAILKEQNPKITHAAAGGHSVVDPETDVRQGSIARNMSLDADAVRQHQHADAIEEKADLPARLDVVTRAYYVATVSVI